jgi:hypothetical protein
MALDLLKQASQEARGRADNFGTWERIFYGEFGGRRPRCEWVLVKMSGE